MDYEQLKYAGKVYMMYGHVSAHNHGSFSERKRLVSMANLSFMSSAQYNQWTLLRRRRCRLL